MNTSGSLHILLVEDLEDDRFFFEHAFRKARLDACLFTAVDGVEAIEFLQDRAGATNGAGLPDVMFLDLKMPVRDGFDVLRWMNEHSLIQRVKVCILSGSAAEHDVKLARELGAREYVVKPITVARLQQLLTPENAPAGLPSPVQVT